MRQRGDEIVRGDRRLLLGFSYKVTPIVAMLFCIVICCIYILGTSAAVRRKTLAGALVGMSLLVRGVLPQVSTGLVMWWQFILGLILLHLVLREL